MTKSQENAVGLLKDFVEEISRFNGDCTYDFDPKSLTYKLPVSIADSDNSAEIMLEIRVRADRIYFEWWYYENVIVKDSDVIEDLLLFLSAANSSIEYGTFVYDNDRKMICLRYTYPLSSFIGFDDFDSQTHFNDMITSIFGALSAEASIFIEEIEYLSEEKDEERKVGNQFFEVGTRRHLS